MHPHHSAAIARFNDIGAKDPRRVTWDGNELPRQLGEALCLWHYVQTLEASPSEALALAVHCQHLRRFAYARSEFPEGREGYLAWRKDAARRSAEEAAEILTELSFPKDLVEAVVAIMTKHDRKRYPDVQTMEDALCLAFFRLDAVDFADKHDESEVTRILRRTWLKMSPRGRELALAEPYPTALREMLLRLSNPDPDANAR